MTGVYETGFGTIPQEYVYIMEKAINHAIVDERRRVLELEAELSKEQFRAERYKEFYEQAIHHAVDLEIQLERTNRGN
jgi:hypothetical protein